MKTKERKEKTGDGKVKRVGNERCGRKREVTGGDERRRRRRGEE